MLSSMAVSQYFLRCSSYRCLFSFASKFTLCQFIFPQSSYSPSPSGQGKQGCPIPGIQTYERPSPGSSPALENSFLLPFWFPRPHRGPREGLPREYWAPPFQSPSQAGQTTPCLEMTLADPRLNLCSSSQSAKSTCNSAAFLASLLQPIGWAHTPADRGR